MSWYEVMLTPLGAVFIGGSDAGLHRLDFMTESRGVRALAERLAYETGELPRSDRDAAADVVDQLSAYFAGTRFSFDLPLAARGTPFQREVWQTLTTIPPGRTQSYGEVAAAIGRPGASRAVGSANSRNPIAIVVPCHRVIGANGELIGYASGLERKRWLLRHEQSALQAAPPNSVGHAAQA